MAKKQKSGVSAPVKLSAPAVSSAATTHSGNEGKNQDNFFLSFRTQAIIIAVLGLIFYFNSFSNEFALDDRPIIIKNEYVQQGISGIPKILTVDAFESYMKQQNSGNVLAGGRYRPLSIVTFAIEQQFLGISPPEVADTSKELKSNNLISDEQMAKYVHEMHVRHVINVFLYIFSIIVLLYFLRNIVFKGIPLAAFITAIIFLIHPIHTEVVANVKSRDEILSLLFLCLTFIFAFRYRDEQKRPDLVKALLFYLLALLSKEYGVTLLVLLPLALYLFRKDTLNASIRATLPYLIPFGLYLIMRLSAENHPTENAPDDVLNVPYLFATQAQKIASIVAILFKYFQLLVVPYPLSSDYSYNQIPYIDFSNIKFWISLAFYGGLIFALIQSFKKRHLLAFAIAFYLINLSLIGNVFVNIGAPMGERLIYHSSLGFAMAVGYGLYLLAQKIKPGITGSVLVLGLVGVITIFAAVDAIGRNPDWKNDRTLFLTDVKTSPNSVLILSNAGSACVDYGDAAKDSTVKKKWYTDGVGYFNRALAVDPKFVNAYQNRGVCFYQLGNADQALSDWDSVRHFYPNHPSLPYLYSVVSNYFYKQGMEHGKANEHEAALISFRKAADATPNSPDIWYNIGYASFSAGHYKEAVYAFERSLRLKPNNARAIDFCAQAKRMIQQ